MKSAEKEDEGHDADTIHPAEIAVHVFLSCCALWSSSQPTRLFAIAPFALPLDKRAQIDHVKQLFRPLSIASDTPAERNMETRREDGEFCLLLLIRFWFFSFVACLSP